MRFPFGSRNVAAALVLLWCATTSAAGGEDPLDLAWSTTFSVPGLTGAVNCMTSFGNTLVTGGRFDYAGSVAARGVAAWDAGAWQAVGDADFGASVDVRGLAVFRNQLVAVGSARSTAAVRGPFVHVWDGNSWTPLQTPGDVTRDSGILCAALYHDDLIVAGWFTTLGGVPCNNIARWDGARWHALGDGTAGNSGAVTSLAVFRDELIAAGDFARAGGRFASHIARWNGSEWHAVGVGLDRPVAAVLQTASGLVAGGDFLTSGTALVRRVAVWKSSSWEPMGLGFDAPVQALLHYKGEIIAGGDFAASGDTKLPGIARWDGVAWQPLGAEFPGATGVFVRALAVHGDDLYTAGWLYKKDGPAREFVAHWDGVTWSVVDAPRATAVLKMVFAGDNLIVGVAASQSPVPMDLVWTWDGKQWNPVGNLLDGWVTALTVRDGTLYAGTSNLEREDGNVWAWTGNEWTPLASRFQGGVRALFPVADGMYAGGAFHRVGTRPAGSIAFWSARVVPVAIEDLRATALESGIRVEWSCTQSGAGSTTLRVERANAEAGPFETVSDWLSPAGLMTFEDFHAQQGEWYWYRIVVRDAGGLQTASPANAARYPPTRAASVWLAAPRPANGGQAIELRYAAGNRPGAVALAVYDVRGRAVRTLVRERATPGVHVVVWDRTDSRGQLVGRGIYFARLEAAGVVRTVRVPMLDR